MGLGAAGDDAFQHVSEPSHRLHAVELGSLNECHRDRPVTGSAIGTSEEYGLSRHWYRPDRALDDIRVHLDASILQEHDQAGPVSQRVAHRYSKSGCT